MADTLANTVTTFGDRAGVERPPGAVAHLYLSLECDRLAAPAARYSLANFDRVVIGRGAERSVDRQREGATRVLHVRVPDSRMSSRHVRLDRALGAWMLSDTESKNGVAINGERVDRAELVDGDVVELGHTLFVYADAVHTPAGTPELADTTALAAMPSGMVTLSPSFGRELERLARIAASTVSILIAGETGTGKELVARAVHTLSGRRGAFVAVNCGAVPDNLIEAELFGHAEGAFSGASRARTGHVRAADGGTLLLDELGDLPLASQAALLRVLQERSVVPIGTSTPVAVDLRVVAATHRDLEALAAAGEFREDLLARVAAARFALPPLRERRCDIGHLIGAIVSRAAPGRDVRITPAAATALLRHAWPRNVRELENALSTALALATDGVIELEHLSPELLSEGPATGALSPADQRLRDELVAALREHGGNVSAAARALGKARQQVQRWIKRLDIRPALYK